MIDPLDPRTLQSAREAAGWSRAFLAAQAKVNETTILRIEKGETDPRLDGTWAPLVRALQVAICASCDLRAEAPQVRACTRTDCPMHAREEREAA